MDPPSESLGGSWHQINAGRVHGRGVCSLPPSSTGQQLGSAEGRGPRRGGPAPRLAPPRVARVGPRAALRLGFLFCRSPGGRGAGWQWLRPQGVAGRAQRQGRSARCSRLPVPGGAAVPSALPWFSAPSRRRRGRCAAAAPGGCGALGGSGGGAGAPPCASCPWLSHGERTSKRSAAQAYGVLRGPRVSGRRTETSADSAGPRAPRVEKDLERAAATTKARVRRVQGASLRGTRGSGLLWGTRALKGGTAQLLRSPVPDPQCPLVSRSWSVCSRFAQQVLPTWPRGALCRQLWGWPPFLASRGRRDSKGVLVLCSDMARVG